MHSSNGHRTHNDNDYDYVCSSSEIPSLYNIHHEASHQLLRLGWVVHWRLIAEGAENDAANSLEVLQTTKSRTAPRVESMKRTEKQRYGKPHTEKYAVNPVKGYCFLCTTEKTGGGVSRLRKAQKRRESPSEPDSVSDQPEKLDMTDEKPPVSDLLSLFLPQERIEYVEFMARLHIRNHWTSFHQYAKLPFPPSAGGALQSSQGALPPLELRGGRSSQVDVARAPPVISSFLLPAWGALEEVSEVEVGGLFSIPHFTPCFGNSSSWLSLPARVFLYQRRCEPPLADTRMDEGASERPAALCACDVYLIFLSNRNAPLELSKHLTVWGRATWSTRAQQSFSLACQDAPTIDSNSSNEELFYISHGLPDYLRLGAIFGWVYGWQLCYSSRGPQMRSVMWLRFFNQNALITARQLVERQRNY
ncbi:unnamed protein product [Phytomonas sp. EM1]|nr:unnamed protein product [Phytomonas sp. EM1]|eukprot:CCW65610.1 unnamed protein product [Phytomonas sp. isolate EM1]